MKKMQASEFKAKCLKVMDQVANSGEEVIITKNGKAVSKLVPYRVPVHSLFGAHAGQLTIIGDILSPIDDDWDAAR